MNTQLIDLAPKLFIAVKESQEALAEWATPGSTVTVEDFTNKLLGILDQRELVKEMRDVEASMNLPIQQVWSDSANVKLTEYYRKDSRLVITFANGTVYEYAEVPFEVWTELTQATSVGTFLHRSIKGTYSYKKIK